MTHPKVRWEEMLPHEFIAARDSFPVCWMAYGLAEPHGAYNALGLDWLKAYSLLEAAARQHGGILIRRLHGILPRFRSSTATARGAAGSGKRMCASRSAVRFPPTSSTALSFTRSVQWTRAASMPPSL